MSNKHLERFFKLNTAPDIMALKVFPNLKEISESMAAFVAVKDHIPYALKDPSVSVVVVGDGHTPRTGVLFARLTAWNVYSIDPVLRIADYKTDRLFLVKKKVEDILPLVANKVVIVSVHSHASAMDSIGSTVANDKWFINIPCCVPCDYKENPVYSYIDDGILSPKNKIDIYHIGGNHGI